MTVAVVEILDRDGLARRSVPIAAWPVTIGRAVDCDVVLDDPHVAPRHLTVSESETGLSVQVGESVNGVEWTRTRLRSGESSPLPTGETIQVGATRLRVRRASDALAPERAMFVEPPAGRLPLPVMLVAVFAWTIGGHWIATDPGARSTDYVPPVVGLAAVLVIWCGLWALISKLFRHRFEFWPHTRIAVGYMLVMEAISVALPLLAFMAGWVFLSRISGMVVGAAGCAMVVAHLTRILPSRRRLLAATIGALFIVGTAVLAFMNYQTNDRVFDELYVSTLAPPALRLAAPVPASKFIEEARSLKAVLDAHVGDDDGTDADTMFLGQQNQHPPR